MGKHTVGAKPLTWALQRIMNKGKAHSTPLSLVDLSITLETISFTAVTGFEL
jgi:hypothetical protein